LRGVSDDGTAFGQNIGAIRKICLQTTFTLYSCNKTSICLLSVAPALFTVFERQYCHEDP